jgi:hypothetical protein
MEEAVPVEAGVGCLELPEQAVEQEPVLLLQREDFHLTRLPTQAEAEEANVREESAMEWETEAQE